ncbi:hypothetical protein QTP70_028719, partial [Hemibagrus guttatus]
MENVLTESYNLLHLSEHLRLTGLQMVGEAETGDQVSKAPHQSLQKEKLKLSTELQEKLCTSENMVQSLQLELSSYQLSIQSMRDHHQFEDAVQSLEMKAMDLGSKDLFHTLQQQLSTTGRQNRVLRQVLMACEARVQEAEKEKQQETESKEACERKLRNLESALDDLQGELKVSQEREENLMRSIEKARANHKAEVEQLQHSLEKTKKEAREMEMKFRTDIMDLKRKLVDEHAFMVRKLKKSLKKEMEFEGTIKKLKLTETPLASGIRVKETERKNPCEVMSDKMCVEKTMKKLHERLNNRLQRTTTDLQGKTQSFLELSSTQLSNQSLRDNLHQSQDAVQSLKTKVKDLRSKDQSHTLQQQLSATEEQNHVLQEVLMAYEAQVHEPEKEKQQEAESKEECEKKIRNLKLLLKGLNNQLEPALDDLQGELKVSQEREENLMSSTEKARANHKAEVEQLQHSLEKNKKEAREMEMKFRTDIMDLKRYLVDEHAFMARELKKSLKKEMEFEETIKELTLTETPLASGIRVKETERKNPCEEQHLFLDCLKKTHEEGLDMEAELSQCSQASAEMNTGIKHLRRAVKWELRE